MKTIGIITVRWDSERLPGKALEMIGDKPLLQHTVDALGCANLTQPPIVVTTDSSQPIIDYCNKNKISVVFGKDDGDILSQMLLAVKKDCNVVRIWGDNPFPFAWLINKGISFFESNSFDYVVGHASDSFCSVVRSDTLFSLNKIRLSKEDRYDIHLWMQNNLHSCILNYPIIPMKLTIDTLEDLERIRRIYDNS